MLHVLAHVSVRLVSRFLVYYFMSLILHLLLVLNYTLDVDTLSVHMIYLTMIVGLFSVLFAPLLSILYRAWLDLPQPPLGLLFISVCIQLITRMLADIFAVKVEASYLKRPVIKVWQRQNEAGKYMQAVMVTAIMSCLLLMEDYTIVVLATASDN